MALISLHVPVSFILLGGGFLACFLGYRLLRLLLALYGFVGGVVIATLYVDQFETWVAILATIAAGLAGSVVAIMAYIAGVALLGAGLSALAVKLAWSSRGGEPDIWLLAVACFVGALVALAFRRYVIITGTALGGAWTFLVGGLALTGNSAAISAVSGDIQYVYPLAPASSQMWFVFGWFGLSGFSVLVQLRSANRRRLSTKKS